MIDFFISYASPDREWAIWIAWQLKEEGYNVVLQDWDFSPGSNFVVNMQRAVTQAERILAVLSSSYIDRRFPQAEWSAAFANDPIGEERKLVPVRIEDFRPKGFFTSIVYVDLVNLREEEARNTLISGVKRAINGSPTLSHPPSFPGSERKEIPRPDHFPGDTIGNKINSKKSRRFIHSRITTNGIIDASVPSNPYQDLFDSTDTVSSEPLCIYCFVWLPRTEVLRSTQLAPLTPVAAICTVDPQDALERFRQVLTPDQILSLDQPPRRLRNEEKLFLCRATGAALKECFILAVTFPELALGLERSQPEVAYQSMMNFFLLPLLGMHKRLGFERFHASLFSVGEKDSTVLQLAKRCAKACFPKKDSVSINLSSGNPSAEAICKMARLFAWAVGHFHNSNDKMWLNELEKSFDS